MYGVAGEKRSIFVESDDFLYTLGDPNYIHMGKVLFDIFSCKPHC
jgi:hypothetical protein